MAKSNDDSRVRAARRKRGLWTQAALAREAGVTRYVVQMLEEGSMVAKVDLRPLDDVARALGLSLCAVIADGSRRWDRPLCAGRKK